MADDNQTEGLSSGDAARQKMQIKSFTAWVNLHLKNDKMEVTNLQSDFADGIKLLRLVEIISDENLGKYNKKPVSKFQKIENLNIPLKFINSFLHEVGIRNSYSAENILEENLTLILGMTWSLILRYNVSQISEGDKTAKEGLLLWAKTKDGIAFNCLIQAYRPDLTDYKKLTASNKVANLDRAFDIAETAIGIPKLLDASDMVSMRPDEKSVMTYVSFFWKAFAANTRKRLAGERITSVVQREQAYEDMQTQYAEGAKALIVWLEGKTELFSAKPECNSQAEIEVVLRAYLDYSRSEKTAKQQELLDLEALASSISSRLATLNREFQPAEDVSLPALQRWWEQLTAAEQTYEAALNGTLKSLKKVELYIKLFNNRANKLEEWLDTKEEWLASQLEVVKAARTQGPLPSLPQSEQAHMRTSSLAEAAPVAASAPASDEPEAEPAKAEPKLESKPETKRKPSFIDHLVSAIAPKPRPATPVAEDTEASGKEEDAEANGEVAEASPSKAQRALLDMHSMAHATDTPRAPRPADVDRVDSVSAVTAKINMFSAYTEELSGRKGVLPELQKLLERIIEAGCPPMRQFSLTNRMGVIDRRLDSIDAKGDEYLDALNAELARQNTMDEMRLSFAKRAEAINRWMEESIDTLTEVFALDSISEAEASLAELGEFGAPLGENEAELRAIEAFHAEMLEMGIAKNQYARFSLEGLQQTMAQCRKAYEERQADLQAALATQKAIDALKRDFAAAADEVLDFVTREKQSLEEVAPATPILPDDSASIAKGKQMLTALESHMSSKARETRAAQLRTVSAISDKLLESAELDNPYTRQTMTSLETYISQLEKVIRDKHSFIEAQLARAQVAISQEQYDEITKAFGHFDKHTNGQLNRLEFSGALKGMGFELSEQEEEEAFTKSAKPNGADAEPSIALDDFVTIVLQQYKEGDTQEALLTAFRTVTDGKDFVTAEQVKQYMPEAEVAYLVSRLHLHDDDHGLDFAPFAANVYGQPTPDVAAPARTDAPADAA